MPENANSITYNYAQILEVSGAIRSFTGNMETDLDDLYQQFRTLFANDWSGQAGQAVDAAQEQWNAGAHEIEQALDRVGQKLDEAVQQMMQLDQSIANAV